MRRVSSATARDAWTEDACVGCCCKGPDRALLRGRAGACSGVGMLRVLLLRLSQVWSLVGCTRVAFLL